LDANGILTVTATEKSSGKSNKITITNDKGRLSKEQIEEMIKKAEEFKEEDEKRKENVETKNGLENYLYNLKNSVLKEPENADQKSPMFDEVKKEAEPLITDALKWLEEHDKEETQVYKDKQKELEEKINPLMMKLYGSAGGGPAGFTPEQATDMPKPDIDEVD
jgi:L1 cell adhesion molecule like protein